MNIDVFHKNVSPSSPGILLSAPSFSCLCSYCSVFEANDLSLFLPAQVLYVEGRGFFLLLLFLTKFVTLFTPTPTQTHPIVQHHVDYI